MAWAVNCDIRKLSGVNKIVDLSILPWPWKDNSILGIYMFHLLEHFPDPKPILQECHRILRPGGFLHIKVPHSSCVSSIGCMGHFRTYSYNTLREHLSEPYYMFTKRMFETRHQKLNWWYEDGSDDNVPLWMQRVISPVDKVLSRLASLSPKVCENLWCYYVGGFREVIWRGVKI